MLGMFGKKYKNTYCQEWEIDQLLQFCRRNFIFSPNMRSIMGFLPADKRITKRLGALKVVLFLWLPRWALAPSKLGRYSYRSQVFLWLPRWAFPPSIMFGVNAGIIGIVGRVCPRRSQDTFMIAAGWPT